VDSLEGEAIPSIPPGDLAPFLSMPVVTDADGIPGVATIIAARDTRVVRGIGDYVYAVNVDEKSGTQWYIYRPGKVLHSFDSNETLGYEMRFLGTARVDRFGDPGQVGLGCRQYATHECSSRDCYPTHAMFRAYRDAADSYLDHGWQLSTLPRYAEAMKHTSDPDRFAREIHAAGYATKRISIAAKIQSPAAA
jgi:hypothetical protein